MRPKYEIKWKHNKETNDDELMAHCVFCDSEQIMYETRCGEGCCNYWNCDKCNKEVDDYVWIDPDEYFSKRGT